MLTFSHFLVANIQQFHKTTKKMLFFSFQTKRVAPKCNPIYSDIHACSADEPSKAPNTVMMNRMISTTAFFLFSFIHSYLLTIDY